MRTALTVLFLVMAIGAGGGILDADDSAERRIDAAFALIGVIGLMVLMKSLRRKLGDQEYARFMGLSPGTTSSVAKFAILTIALPVATYWILTGHTRVDWDGWEGILASALGFAGFTAWGISTRP